MKNQVIAILTSHPGLRIRYIAGRLNASNLEISKILYQLKDEGTVYSRYIRRPEDMEFYDIWFIS